MFDCFVFLFDVEALLFDAFWGPGSPACAMSGQLSDFFFTCFDVQIGVFRGAWGTIGS